MKTTNHQEKSNHKNDTWFFSRGSRACLHTSPRCVNQHLVVRQLRGVARTSSNNWTPQRTYPQVRQLNDTSNLLELPCGSSSRKVQDPSQSPKPATNNHQHMLKLLCCFKPSRWQQSPRETRNPQPQRSSSATRCNHSSKCTLDHSQLTWMMNQSREWVGRLRLSSQGCMDDQNIQESELEPAKL